MSALLRKECVECGRLFETPYPHQISCGKLCAGRRARRQIHGAQQKRRQVEGGIHYPQDDDVYLKSYGAFSEKDTAYVLSTRDVLRQEYEQGQEAMASALRNGVPLSTRVAPRSRPFGPELALLDHAMSRQVEKDEVKAEKGRAKREAKQEQYVRNLAAVRTRARYERQRALRRKRYAR